MIYVNFFKFLNSWNLLWKLLNSKWNLCGDLRAVHGPLCKIQLTLWWTELNVLITVVSLWPYFNHINNFKNLLKFIEFTSITILIWLIDFVGVQRHPVLKAIKNHLALECHSKTCHWVINTSQLSTNKILKTRVEKTI